jgi:hypothetical protein
LNEKLTLDDVMNELLRSGDIARNANEARLLAWHTIADEDLWKYEPEDMMTIPEMFDAVTSSLTHKATIDQEKITAMATAALFILIKWNCYETVQVKTKNCDRAITIAFERRP